MNELIDSFEEGAVSRESIDVHFGSMLTIIPVPR
jgi:hypothetical protein